MNMNIITDNGNKLFDTVSSTSDYVTNKSGELVNTFSGTVDSVSNRVGKTSKYIAERGAEVTGQTTTFVKSNIFKFLPSIIIGSLTLIAGWSWNSAFEALINSYIPEETRTTHNAWIKILYAFILSVIIVIAIALITYYIPTVTFKKKY